MRYKSVLSSYLKWTEAQYSKYVAITVWYTVIVSFVCIYSVKRRRKNAPVSKFCSLWCRVSVRLSYASKVVFWRKSLWTCLACLHPLPIPAWIIAHNLTGWNLQWVSIHGKWCMFMNNEYIRDINISREYCHLCKTVHLGT